MAQHFPNRRVSSKAVAVHEAGHLFANLALRPTLLISHIWIEKEGWGGREWEGALVYGHHQEPSGDMTEREETQAQLLVSLAGPVAERRWQLKRRRSTILCCYSEADECIATETDAPRTDYERAKQLIGRLGSPDPHAAFRSAWLEAEELLHRDWPAILCFAKLLKKRGWIEAEELYLLPDVAARSGWAGFTHGAEESRK